jgi:hypothetical protein
MIYLEENTSEIHAVLVTWLLLCNTRIKPSGHRTLSDHHVERKAKIEWNSRILCLLYLTFASESFSSTATFYVPVLGLNHFHLELIYVKLLFLNCTLFTVLVFILFSDAKLTKLTSQRRIFPRNIEILLVFVS